ncbi:MAG: hypothetical protein K9W44_09595 [Candidatus Lokiarchaeota archaeon]|nr:hypothetical protein [Candidatus Harpocratesius repetitus]
MQIRINFSSEIDQTIINEINFIREEFNYIFGDKEKYTAEDRKIARNLLHYLSKKINSANCIEYLTNVLEDLECSFPTLF